MDSSSLILFILLFILLFGKWLLIILVLPFQALFNHYNNKINAKFFCWPYAMWERLFRGGWSRYMLFHVSLIPSIHIRRFIYKILGCSMGANNVFHFRTEIRSIENLKLGNGNIIGDNVLLDARQGIVIGDNVNLSSNVSIYTEQHDHRNPFFNSKQEGGKVIIGNRVWLGSNVIVLPGVRIGEGAVCCAGCVVTKDIEPFSVVAGIPAKKVNERPHDLKYNFDGWSCRLY